MRFWVVVLAALVVSGPALAEWRFEYRSSPDPRYDRLYRHADPRANPLYRHGNPWAASRHYYAPRVVERCRVELVPGPYGYTEVTRCRPVPHARPPGVYFRLD